MHRLLILVLALPFLGEADHGRAARASFDVEIVAFDLAGRRTNLTRNPAWDSAPAVARDGRVVFLSTRDGAADLYVMNGDGRNVRRLTVGQAIWSEALETSEASWSPRGDKIAFDSQHWAAPPDCARLCTNWDVRVIDSDGSGLTQVALRARAPSWSRDGRRVAYVSDVTAEGTAASVTISRPNGLGSVRLHALNRDADVGPVWSPARNEIAFQARSAAASSTSIYVVGADGRRKRRLATGHDPVWSRDGERLAYIDNHKLYTIDRNGKGMRRLSQRGEFVIGAAWSPRRAVLGFVAGTTIGRFGGTPSNLRIKTVSGDGKRVRMLARTSAVALWGGPVWTPDGKRIIVALEPR